MYSGGHRLVITEANGSFERGRDAIKSQLETQQAMAINTKQTWTREAALFVVEL